jgi:hypothetical protein
MGSDCLENIMKGYGISSYRDVGQRLGHPFWKRGGALREFESLHHDFSECGLIGKSLRSGRRHHVGSNPAIPTVLYCWSGHALPAQATTKDVVDQQIRLVLLSV